MTWAVSNTDQIEQKHGRHRFGRCNGEVLALKPNGTNQFTSTGFDKNKNVKPSDDGGNSATYRIAKLKRDAPEIAEREIRSIKSDIVTLDFSLRVRAGRGWKCEPLITLS